MSGWLRIHCPESSLSNRLPSLNSTIFLHRILERDTCLEFKKTIKLKNVLKSASTGNVTFFFCAEHPFFGEVRKEEKKLAF